MAVNAFDPTHSRLARLALIAGLAPGSMSTAALLAAPPAASAPVTAPAPAPAPGAAAADADHGHPDKGPNGGPLLELGEEEYHLEVLLDEPQDRLTLVTLDAHAKPVTTSAKQVLVSVKRAGKPVQFKLLPATQDGRVIEPVTNFTLQSKELMAVLHDEKSQCRVSLKVGEKFYSAPLAHHHDHEHDHDHDHDRN